MQSYTLPDGRVLRVGGERMMAPEILFRPSLMDVEAPGVAELAFQCVQVLACNLTDCLIPTRAAETPAVRSPCSMLASGLTSCPHGCQGTQPGTGSVAEQRFRCVQVSAACLDHLHRDVIAHSILGWSHSLPCPSARVHSRTACPRCSLSGVACWICPITYILAL